MLYSFLFNANAVHYSDWYGRDVEKLIWNCAILQACDKSLTIYQGDILAASYAENTEQLKEAAHVLFFTLDNAQKAEYVLLYENVYVWTIQHLGEKEAGQLNEALLKDAGYLGCIQVDEGQILHKLFYLDLLMKRYVIEDGCISICVPGAEQDEYLEEIDFLKRCGFEQAKLRGDYDGYQ